MSSALSTSPGFSYTLPVTDAAEVNVTARTFCAQVIIWEMPDATGWPRNFKTMLPVAGGSQVTSIKASTYVFYGPFRPGDIVGTVELASNGGDSSTFAVTEVQAR